MATTVMNKMKGRESEIALGKKVPRGRNRSGADVDSIPFYPKTRVHCTFGCLMDSTRAGTSLRNLIFFLKRFRTLCPVKNTVNNKIPIITNVNGYGIFATNRWNG